jgi:hypothetical protein
MSDKPESKPITKTLTLHSRLLGRWHDVLILEYGLEQAVKGQKLGKAAVLMSIAGRMETARAALDKGKDFTDVSIELSLPEVDIFWKALLKLQPEAFGRNMQGQLETPHAGLLWQMLSDFAEQLGQKMPSESEED